MGARDGWSRRDRYAASEWPKPWTGPETTPWPKPYAPVPVDPRANGVSLLCWRLPYRDSPTTRITRWPDTDTAVPCPCGPDCEGRHALVFADHGRVRVRRVHEPPTPDLADELRQLYPPPPVPRKGRPKAAQAGELRPAATPATPSHTLMPQAELQPEDSPCHTPQDWRQRWARKPLMTIG